MEKETIEIPVIRFEELTIKEFMLEYFAKKYEEKRDNEDYIDADEKRMFELLGDMV